MAKVSFDKRSIYKKTSDDGFYLGYYDPINIPNDQSDYYLVIPSKYDMKPGLLANELFGDPQLLWVFSVMNRDSLKDPIFDFREGLIIRVPTKNRLLSLL